MPRLFTVRKPTFIIALQRQIVASTAAMRYYIGSADMSLHRNLVLLFYSRGNCGFDRRYAA